MRRVVKGLLIAVAVAGLATPAALAVADESTPMIIGGNNATENYSFSALMEGAHGLNCTASLIRPTWILTARHCLTEPDGETESSPAGMSFRIGSLQRLSGGVVAKAKRVVRHDKSADVGLVELTAPVSVKPINLARSTPIGSPIRLIGWGCTFDPADGCTLPQTLQQIDTTIITDAKCGEEAGTNYLCIDNPQGSRGACNGDSGGPAVIKSGDSWVLAGSTGGGTSEKCGEGPSYYADLAVLRPWVESFAGPDGSGTTPPPGGGTNLALNRPTKSKQAPCSAKETPDKAVNGSSTGGSADKWCSADGTTKMFEVDLGTNRKLTKLVVKHAGAGGEAASLNTKNFVLEVSTGGGVWNPAATITNNTASTTTHTVNVTARWIRLATTDPVARIYEYEAY